MYKPTVVRTTIEETFEELRNFYEEGWEHTGATWIGGENILLFFRKPK